MNNKIALRKLNELYEKTPSHQIISRLDLALIKYGNSISVLYGRCLHRGALLSDGHIDGHNLICGAHHWDYRYDSG